MSEALQPAMPAPATVSNWNLFKDKAANAAHSAAESTKHAFEVLYKTSADFLRKVYDFFVNVGLPKIADAFRTGKEWTVDHVKRVIEFLSVHREQALLVAVTAVVTTAVVFIVHDQLYRRPVVDAPREAAVRTTPPVNSASVAAASSSSAPSSSSSSSTSSSAPSVQTSTTVAATSSSSSSSSSSHAARPAPLAPGVVIEDAGEQKTAHV
ncbi:MAG TPA: hypothetical protein VLG76_07885 [Rhabdochlamydiaceae bacterium]|nr:hypothetical protein [Rhabdochlamydiaceae bacterium]